jgi:hypothetical protein
MKTQILTVLIAAVMLVGSAAAGYEVTKAHLASASLGAAEDDRPRTASAGFDQARIYVVALAPARFAVRAHGPTESPPRIVMLQP